MRGRLISATVLIKSFWRNQIYDTNALRFLVLPNREVLFVAPTQLINDCMEIKALTGGLSPATMTTGPAYFTEMCSGSKAGSYFRLIDLVYHSTLGLRVIKKRRRLRRVQEGCLQRR